MRTVIYARYSSDSQRDASIEDQVRLCRTRIAQEGWVQEESEAPRAGTSQHFRVAWPHLKRLAGKWIDLSDIMS